MESILNIINDGSIEFIKGLLLGLCLGCILGFYNNVSLRKEKELLLKENMMLRENIKKEKNIAIKEKELFLQENKNLKDDIKNLKHEIATLNASLTAKDFKL